jgi:hypothetical protein
MSNLCAAILPDLITNGALGVDAHAMRFLSRTAVTSVKGAFRYL